MHLAYALVCLFVKYSLLAAPYFYRRQRFINHLLIYLLKKDVNKSATTATGFTTKDEHLIKVD